MDFSGGIIGNICHIWLPQKKCHKSEHYLTKTDLNVPLFITTVTHFDVFQNIKWNSDILAVEQQFIFHQRRQGDLFLLIPLPRCHRVPTAHRPGAQSLGARETLPLTPKSRRTLSEGLTLHRWHCSGVASSEKLSDSQLGSPLSLALCGRTLAFRTSWGCDNTREGKKKLSPGKRPHP